MKFLKDLDLNGKRVLYRVDINSDIRDGKIQDDTRIRTIVPTLEYLLGHGAEQIILLAHQGRDKKRAPETVLDLHAKRLEELIGQPVLKLDTSRPTQVPEAKIVMLENVRLDDEDHAELSKRESFAQHLAKLGDVYVNDAFAACHRDHATISSLPKLMKEKAAGLLLQKEIEALHPLLKGRVQEPFTVIIGGAKIDTKLGLIERFMGKADAFLLGGGIANTFLFAEGYDVGQSLKEENKVKLAREIAMKLEVKKGTKLHLPIDVVCADEPSEEASVVDVPVKDVIGDMKIFDIGAKTSGHYVDMISKSKTIIWNGPMGLTEYPHFCYGSEAIARAMAAVDATTIIGGGESVALLNSLGIPHEKFTHVSTGGGAMLEYLGGTELPGIAALS